MSEIFKYLDYGPAFNFSRKWYAILTETNKERLACIWLKRRQYAPYWPRYQGREKVNRRRFVARWRSVLPGYLFLPVVDEPNWAVLERMPGYRRIMRDGAGNVVTIPERGKQGIEQIREIEMACNSSAIAAEEGIPFREGQKCRLIKIPEVLGEVKRIISKHKIEIEIQMFGGLTLTQVPAAEIEAL